MKSDEFNETTKPPRYTYRRSPVQDSAFQILEYKNGMTSAPVPAGEYTVLDKTEDPGLSEKKVMNLVALLNGRNNIMDLGNGTKTRTLHHTLPGTDEEGRSKIMFYKLEEGAGVSKQNALLRIKEISDASH